MLNGQTGGSGGIHILPNVDCKIQRGAMKEVSSAKHSIDLCAISESTNEYPVKAKVVKSWYVHLGGKDRCISISK